MDRDIRLELHALLEAAYPDLTIYYRPPSNLPLEYPCIVYSLAGHDLSHSNNSTYNVGDIFDVSLITVRPGTTHSNNPMLKIRGCTLTTIYSQANLIHNKFRITII